MKKKLLFLFPLLLILVQAGRAQILPQFTKSGGQYATTSPFNSTTSNQIQAIYTPAGIVPTGVAGYIYKVYLKSTSAVASSTISNLVIGLDTTSYTTFPTTGTAWAPIKDTVLNAPTYTVSNLAANAWFVVTLQKPFYYDGVHNFILSAVTSAYTTGFSLSRTNVANTAATGSPAGTPLAVAGVPDLGFDFIQSNDAGVATLVSPTSGFCNGNYDIKVQINNYGTKQLSGVNINWTMDNIAQPPVVYSGAVLDSFYGSGAKSAIVTLSNIAFPPKTLHTFKVWTSLPNGSADIANNNDTISFSINSTIPAGTYTIGPSGDYTTIAAAVNALNTYGICGPVVFNILSGTYIEQAIINNIFGASTTNTITFQPASGKLGDVTIQNTATASASNYIIKLNSASYVTLKKLVLTPYNPNLCTALSMTGLVSNNTVDSCRFIASTGSSTGTGFYLLSAYTGILAGSGNNVFRYTLFKGGGNSIQYIGNGTTYDQPDIFEYDTIINGYGSGITANNINGVKIRNNTINITSTNPSTVIGINFAIAKGAYEITGNNVTISAGGCKGIYTQSSASTDYGTIANNSFNLTATALNSTSYGIHDLSNTLNVFNNTIALQTTAVGKVTAYGIYHAIGSNVNYYNNSINHNSLGTSGDNYAFYIENDNGMTNISARNNIFAYNGTNATNAAAMFIGSDILAGVTSDYNNLYSASPNITAIGQNSASLYYTSIPAWRAKNQDAHSLSYAPGFISNSDLHPNPTDTNSWSLNGRGIQITGNTTDLVNNVRSATLANGAPDLGAYEFVPIANPPKAIATPATPVANSSQLFTFGGDTVATIAWGAAVPANTIVQQYSGTVPPAYTGTNMDFYTAITGGAGTYNYTANIYYKRTWLRAVPTEFSLRMIKGNGSTWQLLDAATSSADTIAKIITAPAMTTLGLYSGSKTLIVPVAGPITGNLAICKGSTSQLADTSANGTWSSSAPTIASISSTGLVTAKGVGTTTISYTVPAGIATAIVTVSDTPTVAIITGASTICQGATTQLNDVTSGGVWSSGATPIATIGTTGLVTAATSNSGIATIKYTVTNANNCSSFVNYPVTVNVKPVTPSAISGITQLCQGAVTALTSTPANGTWSSSTPTIAYIEASTGVVTADVVNFGTATITYTVANANCSSSINTVITVSTVPLATMSPAGTVNLCEGDSVIISGNSNSGFTYQWLNGTPIAGATNTTYVAKVAGNYSVEVANSSGCKDTSLTNNVVVHTLPNPVVTYNNPILSTGSYNSYQWYKDGQIISGATSQTYTATAVGIYSVLVTDVNSCSRQSAGTTVTDVSVVSNVVANNSKIKIYPNPASNVVKINAPMPVNITISSIDGKVMIQQNNATEINVSYLADALYMIKVFDQNGQLLSIEKLVKTAR